MNDRLTAENSGYPPAARSSAALLTGLINPWPGFALFRTPGSWRRDPAAPLILLDLMFSPSWASDPGWLSVSSQARGEFCVLSGQALQSPSAPASCRQLTADRRTREAGTGTASADITHSQQRGCWQEHGQKTAYARSNLTGPAV